MDSKIICICASKVVLLATMFLCPLLLLVGCVSPKRAAYSEAQLQAVKLVKEGLAAKEPEKEKEACLKAIQVDPYNAYAHNNLGVCLLNEQQYYRAAQEFDAAMKLAPHAPEPQFNLALLYETVGKLDQAAEHYLRALEIAPQSAKYRVCLARTHIKRGRDLWQAKQLLDDALKREIDPQVIAWIHDAQESLRSGKYDLEPLK